VVCLGFVIFQTSKQTLSGFLTICCGAAPRQEKYKDSNEKRMDNRKGKVAFFVIYFMTTCLIVLFFSFVPFAGKMDIERTVTCEMIGE